MGNPRNEAITQQRGVANKFGAQANQEAQNIYGGLEPMLSNEATNPQGFSPSDLNAMTTASNEALGGAVSGAVGQGGLQAERTGNSAGYSEALDQAVRDAGKTQSQNALGVQEANAQEKLKQQQAGIAGLEGLYGTNTGEVQNMTGTGASAASSMSGPFWESFLTSMMGDAAQVGSAALKR